MKKIVLDGKKFIDSRTTHKILKNTFKFPDYYGENLDAFWDCITDHAIDCLHDGPEKIIWKNFNLSRENIGDEADMLLECLNDASEQYGGLIIEVIPNDDWRRKYIKDKLFKWILRILILVFLIVMLLHSIKFQLQLQFLEQLSDEYIQMYQDLYEEYIKNL